MGETVLGEIIGEVVEKLPVMLVKKTGVRDEHALVILRSTREYRGDESNPKTASLIAEQIGETGRLVVLVARQIGIRKLAHRHKQCGNPQPLQHSRQSFVTIIGGQCIAGEKPHGQSKNEKSETDE